MAADMRNFRSAYYEKVGFRSVEEKKSLEILLKDKPLDRGKLKQFCLRFSVPATYRNLIWKLLLGVIPVHVECHSFIMEQRRQEYNDLHRALNILQVSDQTTPKSHVFFGMWLLQTGNYAHNVNSNSDRGFLTIVQAFMIFFKDDTDVYWLARKFYENVLKFRGDVPKMVERALGLLEKEDPEYYRSLGKNGVLDHLPLKKWFDCCFAGILHDSALAKIWDKLCGGSYKILVFVVAAMLLNLKDMILPFSRNVNAVLDCITNITEETADVIASKAIEMWQHYGSPLTINDKPNPNKIV